MASARKMFGDDCKVIIRNLSHEYGKQIIEYLSGDTYRSNMTEVERLQLLFDHGLSAYDVKVELANGELVPTTKHCIHHLRKDVREKIGISATGLVRGGRKDAGEYEKTMGCVIRFDLTEDSWQQRKC